MNAMNEKLNQLFQALEQVEQTLLSAKDQNGGWSPLEVLQHLEASERKSTAYMEKKTQANPNDLPKISLKVKFKSWMTGRVFRGNKKFKAPKAYPV